ncbi:MAG: hypothetical protein IJZ29_00165 [Clostridia bacterium]|nr:hypothetical protein [Clostridia bacterium]
MKNKKIKLLALFCCLTLCVLFSGCAKVTYSLIRPDDYTITQQIKVELDSDAINEHGVNLIEMKSDIENYVLSYNSQMQNQFNSNLITLSLLSTYDSTLATKLKNAVIAEYAWLGNTFIYNIHFNAIIEDSTLVLPVENVYYFYYTGSFEQEDEENDGIESQLKEDLFITMYKETYTTSFDSVMCDTIEQAFLDKYGIYGFTTEDVAYAYQYGQQYSRVHSDADYITNQDGVYIHTWNLDSKDEEITLYRLYANQIPWYVVAIICGLLSVAIVFTIAYVKNRKSKLATNVEINQNNLTDAK